MELIKSRPVGISILAALLAIQGIFQLGYGFLVWFTAPAVVVSYGAIVLVKQVFPGGLLLLSGVGFLSCGRLRSRRNPIG